MSEPKLCPYRHPLFDHNKFTSDKSWAVMEDTFLPCLQEECAMWRYANCFLPAYDDKPERIEAIGHCGLAGKP